MTATPALTPPPVVRAARVSQPPADAFAIFTGAIGAWWPLPTHSAFGERSGGLAFRDGRLVEVAVDGAEAVWGEVLAWEPPHRLVITWHPGRGADESSQVEVAFEPDGEGTRVVVEHRGWEAFGKDAMARRRGYAGPNAWGHVLDHFADVAEPRLDAPDLGELAAAYESLYAEAERGGFGPPPEGEWDADHVLAHVAMNDAAMLAVSHAIIHGRPGRLENQTCQDRDAMAAWIAGCGDRAGLIARGRDAARQLLAVLARLSADQRATEVPCRLTHDGRLVVDEPRPWESMAIAGQAGFHLPAHIGQLRDLRADG